MTDPVDRGNGGDLAEACEPACARHCPEHENVALRLLRTEVDTGRLVAAIRQEGSESRHRDEGQREAISDIQRTMNQVVETLRRFEDEQAKIAYALGLGHG